MEFIDCPKCLRRLRAPEVGSRSILRCPSCKHVFRAGQAGDGNGSVAAGANARPAPEAASAARQDAAAAEAPGSDAAGAPAGAAEPRPEDFTGQVMLTPEDEALLREFGSGSGLLELTREAYEMSVTGKPAGRTKSSRLPPEAEKLPGQLPPAGEADRQFQVVGTALALANKLVQAHKAELERARRSALLGWIAVAALALVAAGSLAWGVWQSGRANTEQVKATGLNSTLTTVASQLSEERLRMPKLTDDLEAAQKERRLLQAELAAAKEGLIQAKSDTLVATARLDAASARLEALKAEMGRAGAATRPAMTQPAARE